VGILRCTSCSCQLLLAAWLSGCLLPVLVLSWCPSEYRWSQYLWRGSFSPGRILGWASQICRKGQKPGAGAMVITSQSFCCDSVLASDPYCCTGTLTPSLEKSHSGRCSAPLQPQRTQGHKSYPLVHAPRLPEGSGQSLPSPAPCLSLSTIPFSHRCSPVHLTSQGLSVGCQPQTLHADRSSFLGPL
jgi:hypothetical protein